MSAHVFASGSSGIAAVLDLMAWFLAAVILLVAVLFHRLPEITRPDIFFAVTVNPDFRASGDARHVLGQFRIALWIQTAIAVAIVFAGTAAGSTWVPLAGIFWQAAGVLAAFLRARSGTLPHAAAPTGQREAELAPRSAGGVSFGLLQAGPFAILAACAAYLKANWKRIPERFPVHWGADGRPNGWATRSPSGVYGPLVTGAIIIALLVVLSYAILILTRHVRASGAAAGAESRFRQAQLGVLVVVEYFVATMLAGVPLLALRQQASQMPSVAPVIVGALVLVVGIFAVLIYTGQGGARLARAEGPGAAQSAVVGDRTPDRCWKAGMFYVNPDDPAILVEKRFGIGYTLNFGHPAAWILTGALLLVAVLSAVIAGLSTHAH